jgi:hypothetical protein
MTAELDASGRSAALAGLASKLGLASGPLAAGFLLASDRYVLLINLAAATMLICALVASRPAAFLDRRAA